MTTNTQSWQEYRIHKALTDMLVDLDYTQSIAYSALVTAVRGARIKPAAVLGWLSTQATEGRLKLYKQLSGKTGRAPMFISPTDKWEDAPPVFSVTPQA